jgi:hypothetical protein
MLPIKINNGILTLDEDSARREALRNNNEYINAPHYGHIIIDNFLPDEVASLILDNFPNQSSDQDVRFQNGTFENNKRQISPYSSSSIVLSHFLFFNSAPFIEYLENLTGIKGLISDHHFGGGGFHETSKGGKLGVHADFRIHPKLKAHRRLNVIIYLNKEWRTEWKGQLELWSPDMRSLISSIEPQFNRCIIFNTERNAFHGHPEPLETPEGITRKSMALYYYTASDLVYSEELNVSTIFKARPNDSSFDKFRSLLQNIQERYFSVGQWMPPILYYSLRSIRKRLKGSDEK